MGQITVFASEQKQFGSVLLAIPLPRLWKFLDELSCRFQVIWLPPYCPELNDIEHIWKYVKGASLANFDFGDSSSLRQAIVEVFDELNSNPQSDLTLRFRDPLSRNLLEVSKKPQVQVQIYGSYPRLPQMPLCTHCTSALPSSVTGVKSPTQVRMLSRPCLIVSIPFHLWYSARPSA